MSDNQTYRGQKRLADIGLDSLQRAAVLEWFADKLWVAQEEGSGLREYMGKSYDPLLIELSTDGSGTAHSYVFHLGDGGRHHPFGSLDELEDRLVDEAVQTVKWAWRQTPEAWQSSTFYVEDEVV